MPQPKLSPERLQEAVDAVDRFDGNEVHAAAFLKIPRGTLQHRLRSARMAGIRPKERPQAPIIDAPAKPRVRVQAGSSAGATSYRVLAIGDAHDSPEIVKDRFYWLGRHAADCGVDYVIQIGDMLTLDSLNSHIPNDTLAGKAKNPYWADMESGEEALGQFDRGAGSHTMKRHITAGNHERRAWIFEDENPESQGLLVGPLTCMWEQHGWAWSEYGEFFFLGGVGFVHAALNRLGKTYGGKNAEQTIANDAMFDIVVGHSHVPRMWKAPKIGPSQHVSVLNLGCALPYGHVESYAKHATTGWGWGAYTLRITRGHIEDASFIGMDELGRRYG